MRSFRPSGGRPDRSGLLLRLAAVLLAVALATPVLLLAALWAGTHLGTVAALMLAGVVWEPPFVLFWGEARGQARGKRSLWGWGANSQFDRELRRLLDEQGPAAD